MGDFIKLFGKLLKKLLCYSDFYISRWLRSFTEFPTKQVKMLKPNSFDEAIFVLEEIAEKEAELRIILNQQDNSRDFATVLHHGFGQTIRNEWKLWVGHSKLYQDMYLSFGLFHADDMSSVILQTFWQRFHGYPETPNIFSMAYLWYWQGMKKTGEWDGQANGGPVNLEMIPSVRAGIKMEKLKLEVWAEKGNKLEATK